MGFLASEKWAGRDPENEDEIASSDCVHGDVPQVEGMNWKFSYSINPCFPKLRNRASLNAKNACVENAVLGNLTLLSLQWR